MPAAGDGGQHFSGSRLDVGLANIDTLVVTDSGGLSNAVTTDTPQTLTGVKNFANGLLDPLVPYVVYGLDTQGTAAAATANTTLLQNMLNSIPINAIGQAGGGACIYLPAGKIFFNNLVFPNHCGMIGQGIEQTWLLQADGNAVNALTNKEIGDARQIFADFRLDMVANTVALGGLVLTGSSQNRLRDIQVQHTTTDAIAIIGGGIATTGDAMHSEAYGVEVLNIISGNHLRLAPAAAGGSHPDNFRWFGGRFQSNVGVGVKVDAASADTSGFLAADTGQFFGLGMQNVPTPVSMAGGAYFLFSGGRWEVVSGTMTVSLVNTNPTNSPTTRNVFSGISMATYGDTTKLVISDAGIETAFVGCIWAGGWL